MADEQYTDAQLADGTTLRFKGQLKPEEVAAKVKAYKASLDPQAGAQEAKAISPRTTSDKLKSGVLATAPWLPAAGGAVGGFLGGPLGAGAGGVAGKAGQRLLETAVYGKEPTGQTPTEAGTELLESGGEQAALEGIGSAVSKGAKVIAGKGGERFVNRPLNRMLRVPYEASEGAVQRYPGEILAKQPGLPTFTTRKGMQEFIRNRIDTLTSGLESTSNQLTQQGATVDLQTPVANSIAKLGKLADKFEYKNIVKTLADTENKITTESVPGNFIAHPSGRLIPVRQSRGLANFTMDDALKYRREIGKLARMKGISGTTQDALLSVYDDVTKAIHQASPEMAAHDAQITGLIKAEEAMGRRIHHMEMGTVETTAGKGPEEAIERKLHIPGTRTVPYYVGKHKVYSAAQKAAKVVGGGAKRQAVIKQVPRALAGYAQDEPTEPPEE